MAVPGPGAPEVSATTAAPAARFWTGAGPLAAAACGASTMVAAMVVNAAADSAAHRRVAVRGRSVRAVATSMFGRAAVDVLMIVDGRNRLRSPTSRRRAVSVDVPTGERRTGLPLRYG